MADLFLAQFQDCRCVRNVTGHKHKECLSEGTYYDTQEVAGETTIPPPQRLVFMWTVSWIQRQFWVDLEVGVLRVLVSCGGLELERRVEYRRSLWNQRKIGRASCRERVCYAV